MHARHACTHARTCTMPPARRRQRRTARCDTATAWGNAHWREVPAGCARAAARAASPGVRFKELCPKAASPAGPHVPFWDTPPQARGLPNKQQDGALAPGRTVPGAGQRGIVVRSFADDPSLSGCILVGSAVPSLQSPASHNRGFESLCVCVCVYVCVCVCVCDYSKAINLGT